MYPGLVCTLQLVPKWLCLEMGYPGVRVALFCFKEPWLLKTIRVYSICYMDPRVPCTWSLSGFVWKWGNPGVRVALFCFKEPWLLKTIRVYSICYMDPCVPCTLSLSGFVWKWDTLGLGLPFFVLSNPGSWKPSGFILYVTWTLCTLRLVP